SVGCLLLPDERPTRNAAYPPPALHLRSSPPILLPGGLFHARRNVAALWAPAPNREPSPPSTVPFPPCPQSEGGPPGYHQESANWGHRSQPPRRAERHGVKGGREDKCSRRQQPRRQPDPGQPGKTQSQNSQPMPHLLLDSRLPPGQSFRANA